MKLKVYGWYSGPCHPSQRRSNTIRVIVAARSYAAVERACKAVHVHAPGRAYCSQTWNEQEIAVALPEPGVLFWSPETGPRRYARWPIE